MFNLIVSNDACYWKTMLQYIIRINLTAKVENAQKNNAAEDKYVIV